MQSYDVIVVGIGAMGSAAAYQLARRGQRVLALEQFSVAHNRGSSHGTTRLIRRAYFEHPDYVPLVNRSYELWAELEQRSGKKLFHRTGLALFGPRDGTILPNVRLAAAGHHLDIETLSLDDAAKRFPMFRLNATRRLQGTHRLDARSAAPADWECLYEPDAGYLLAEESVRTFVEQAATMGATIQTGETMSSWAKNRDGVRVVTDARTYEAARLILCAGAWTGRLLSELGLPLTLRRKVIQWFQTTDDAFRADRGCPVFGFDIPVPDPSPDLGIVRSRAGCDPVPTSGAPAGFFYGFPVVDSDGLKLSDHRGGTVITDPDKLDRGWGGTPEWTSLSQFASEFLRGSFVEDRRSVCMYTMTPDEHFIVDRHPSAENVLFAAGFSGHGFKFAPLIGSVLADLAMNGTTAEPVEFLRLAQFGDRWSSRP